GFAGVPCGFWPNVRTYFCEGWCPSVFGQRLPHAADAIAGNLTDIDVVDDGFGSPTGSWRFHCRPHHRNLYRWQRKFGGALSDHAVSTIGDGIHFEYRVHLKSCGGRKIQREGSHANYHGNLVAQPARVHNRDGCGQHVANNLQAYTGGVERFSPGDETL